MSVSYWDASNGRGLNRILYQAEPLDLKVNPHTPFRKICADIYDEFGTGYFPEDNFTILGKKPVGRRIVGKVEGGRGTTLDKIIEIGDQEFKINIKGSSARFDGKEKYYARFLRSDFVKGAAQKARAQELFDKKGFLDIICDIHSEMSTPHGGQAYRRSIWALNRSEDLFSKTLGMHICPVLMVPKLNPDDIVGYTSLEGYSNQYVGDYGQDIRLVPSNVRVKPVDSDMGIHDLDDELFEKLMDDERVSHQEFIENLMASFVRASCLPFNTMNMSDGLCSAYCYSNVNPKKDGVMGGDGVLYFSDLEGIFYNYDIKETDISQYISTIQSDINCLAQILSCASNKCKKNILKENKSIVEENLPKNLEISKTDSDNRIYLSTTLLDDP